MISNTITSQPICSRTRKPFYPAAIILSAIFSIHFIAPTVAQTKPISRQAFAGGLMNGCMKNRSRETCLCYANAVVARYNEPQLDAMYRQMKLKAESRKMFFLVHAPEMNNCIAKTKK